MPGGLTPLKCDPDGMCNQCGSPTKAGKTTIDFDPSTIRTLKIKREPQSEEEQKSVKGVPSIDLYRK